MSLNCNYLHELHIHPTEFMPSIVSIYCSLPDRGVVTFANATFCEFVENVLTSIIAINK